MSFQVISLLLAVFEPMLFMIVPHNLPVHYYALHAIQKVYFSTPPPKLANHSTDAGKYAMKYSCQRSPTTNALQPRYNAHFAWPPERVL